MNVTKLKQNQLLERQIKRDIESESILESMDLDNPFKKCLTFESVDTVTLDDKPEACNNCNGTGSVKSLFSSYECYLCYGTGYDLSDPIKLIKWQQLCMQWSKNKIRKLDHELHIAKTTEAERMERSMNEFYKDIKQKNHYRGD